ncbi:MAG: YhcH/YjgK/YiaL family protein [Christensenellaceae bacterium]|nr:YhcH/YjgK/YiaL family protein [Christensenellaceae bacterium]
MIVDHIANAEKYKALSPAFAAAMTFLQEHKDGIREDRIDVNEDVFALRKSYVSFDEADCKYECHKEYIDVQYVASGREAMGWGRVEDFAVAEAREADDLYFLSGKGELHPLVAGTFMILFPEDAHMPTVKLEQNEQIEKIVVKVKVGK